MIVDTSRTSYSLQTPMFKSPLLLYIGACQEGAENITQEAIFFFNFVAPKCVLVSIERFYLQPQPPIIKELIFFET